MNSFAHYRKTCIFVIAILSNLAQAPIVMAGEFDFSTAWKFVTERSNVLVAEQASIDHAEYTRQANRDLYLP